MDISPLGDLRDFRLLLQGKAADSAGHLHARLHVRRGQGQTGGSARPGSWSMSPRRYGNIFVGRTKEGFSTSKIMVGYQGWTNERATINDAFLPILADGVKWTGYIPSGKLVYNLGFFWNDRTENESFNKNDKSVRGARRVAAARRNGQGRAAPRAAGAPRAVERRATAVPLQARILPGAVVCHRYRQVRGRHRPTRTASRPTTGPAR